MLLVIFSILLLNIQPYKEDVRYYSTFSVTFILLLALLYTSCIGYHVANESDKKFTLLFLVSAVFAGVFPIFYFVAIFFSLDVQQQSLWSELTDTEAESEDSWI